VSVRGDEKKFVLHVEKATFVPEVAAIRQFVTELKAEFAANPKQAQAFQDDPGAFLSGRGMCTDLLREWTTEIGLAGADFSCAVLSCVVSEDSCIITTETIGDIVLGALPE
jgi:hypothetical protein